jgi:hypothetical protein
LKRFSAKASNSEVARNIVVEHLKTAELPFLSMNQAYALVVEESRHLLRRTVRQGKLSLEQRKYRKDIFANNFFSDKRLIVNPASDGSFILFLRETAHHPITRKLISLFDHRRLMTEALSIPLPKAAQG